MGTHERVDSGARSRLGIPAASAPANPYGFMAAIVGILVGEVVATLALAVATGLARKGGISALERDVVGLFGLWIGFVGTCALAASSPAAAPTGRRGLTAAYGLRIRPLDVPLGIVCGLAGQYLLVPLLELPLLPFVPHLFQRLGAPARSLTDGATGAKLALLGVLVCVGSPLVEELFFRGLLLRGLLGATRDKMGWTPVAAAAFSAVLSGLIFGLVHFEALQLLALSGFGALLAVLAMRTGRLGAGFIAHLTFNTVTFVALALGH